MVDRCHIFMSECCHYVPISYILQSLIITVTSLDTLIPVNTHKNIRKIHIRGFEWLRV